MRVEIKIINELPFGSKDDQRKTKEDFIKLSKTFFPFGILSEEKTNGHSIKRTASWSGSLEDFIRLIEIRESFGKEYEPKELIKAYVEIMAKAG